MINVIRHHMRFSFENWRLWVGRSEGSVRYQSEARSDHHELPRIEDKVDQHIERFNVNGGWAERYKRQD